MKKVSVIALFHPEHPELYLHMLRGDTQKWTLPCGSSNPGELPHETAARELQEEAGLEIKEMSACRNGCFESGEDPHGVHITLFHSPFPSGQSPDSFDDPDKEGVTFKFLNPLTHDNLHIEGDRNILIQHLKSGLTKSEPISKKELDPKLGYKFKYLPPKSASGPYSLHTVTVHDKTGQQVGHLVAEDVGDGDYMPNMIHVDEPHRRQGIGGKLHQVMQRHTGLKAIPDLISQTDAARGMWKDPKRKFGKKKINKAEINQPLAPDTEQGNKLQAIASKIQAIKQLKAQNPEIDWDKAFPEQKQESGRSRRKLREIGLKAHLTRRIK